MVKQYTILFIGCMLLGIAGMAQTKVDKASLEKLITACKDTHSAGLAIWVDGKPYQEHSFEPGDKNVPSYSAHKSLISLTIGRLLMDGKLSSIDSPVSQFYPEWRQGLKKKITIRHLLNHTSALEYVDIDPDGWSQRDIIQYSLCASVIDTPGNYFLYNDRAVNLLRGIIEKAAGKRMDIYINEVFFQPMSITSYVWEYDSAGTPENLLIAPSEFVKLGQLILNNGNWNGKQLVQKSWLSESLAQGQPFVPNCGLLWWRRPESINYTVDDELIADMKRAGVPEAFLQKFVLLKGVYKDVNIPDEKLTAVYGKNWKALLEKELYPYYPRRAKWAMSDRYIGYKAEGWLGQYIVIYPDKKIVACRMVRQGDKYDGQKDDFRDFEKYVYNLVK
jgi:CubicO group peptidase (beta-lactamase class C family)